jgi:hypothetical protein
VPLSMDDCEDDYQGRYERVSGHRVFSLRLSPVFRQGRDTDETPDRGDAG